MTKHFTTKIKAVIFAALLLPFSIPNIRIAVI